MIFPYQSLQALRAALPHRQRGMEVQEAFLDAMLTLCGLNGSFIETSLALVIEQMVALDIDTTEDDLDQMDDGASESGNADGGVGSGLKGVGGSTALHGHAANDREDGDDDDNGDDGSCTDGDSHASDSPTRRVGKIGSENTPFFEMELDSVAELTSSKGAIAVDVDDDVHEDSHIEDGDDASTASFTMAEKLDVLMCRTLEFLQPLIAVPVC
jgi:hypothetical protein